MRTLLKILQSDSSALWIKFYSLMYEAENVKNIVECCPDKVMDGCRVGASTMETGWSEVTPEKDIILWNPACYKNTGLGLQPEDWSLFFYGLLNMFVPLLTSLKNSFSVHTVASLFSNYKINLKSSLRTKLQSSAVGKRWLIVYTLVLAPSTDF